MRPARPALALALTSAVVALSWPSTPPADASCAAPMLSVGGEDRPQLVAGEAVEVEGRFFTDGCGDNGTVEGGCSAPEMSPSSPMTEVTLRLRQDGRTHDLAEADAATAEDGTPGAIAWQVTLPQGARPGRAVLTTDRVTEPLAVRISR